MQIDRTIAIAFIILIISLLVYFLVWPEYKSFQQLRLELSTKKAEYKAELLYYTAITKTYLDLQKRPDDIKKIDDALPQSPSLNKIVYLLQETAKKNGMIIRNLSLSKSSIIAASAKAKANPVKDISFSMDMSGDYVSLEGFIVSLEKSSRLFEITNISFGYASASLSSSAKASPQSRQIYNFNLLVKTHSY